MKRLATATIMVLGISLLLASTVAAQGNDGEKRLSPHLRSQLWPEQQLTPAQKEYKAKVIAMRDTVTRVKATIEVVDRARRSRNSPTLLLSASRRLGNDCQRVDRNAERMIPWANGLSTDNSRFGEPAIRVYRKALADLKRQMASCSSRLEKLTADQNSLVRDDVYAVLQNSRKAITEYESATESLSNTLKITILPTEKS